MLYKAMTDEYGVIWVVTQTGDIWAADREGNLVLRRKYIEGVPPDAPGHVRAWREQADSMENRRIVEEARMVSAAKAKLTQEELTALGL